MRNCPPTDHREHDYHEVKHIPRSSEVVESQADYLDDGFYYKHHSEE